MLAVVVLWNVWAIWANLFAEPVYSSALKIEASPVTANSGNLTLAWDPMSNPIVAGFNIYYGHESGVYLYKVRAGNVTSLVLSNLPTGLDYYFAATTYTAAGAESALSGEVYFYFPRPVLAGVESVLAPVGSNVVLQMATNLAGPWLPVATNRVPFSVTNQAAGFYRLKA